MTQKEYDYYKARWLDVRKKKAQGVSIKDIADEYNMRVGDLNKLLKREKFVAPESIVANPIFEGQPKYIKYGRDRIRFMVRNRDSLTCQSCGKKWKEGQRHFDVHHLDGFCGKRSRGYDSVKDISNLITLCHKCHYNHPEHTLKRRQKLSTPWTHKGRGCGVLWE